VTAHAVDLASADGPATLVERALAEHGRIDVLVNNVGGAPVRLDGFLALSDEDIAWTMNINFHSAVRAIRAVLPGMIERGSGAIVNVASVNAILTDPNVIDYAAAKAALVNFSKSLSREVAPKGIRINDVSPGPVATDLWLGEGGVADTIAKAGGGDAKAGAEAAMPTGRFTQPDEVAALVALLASDRAGNVTGSQYVIDGGLVQTV
jgi:NAD(P)-dependent dehydrogenase (short-subunit alcohol dehydrogenase family)